MAMNTFRFLLVFSLLLAFSSMAFAQSDEEIKDRVNQLKLDPSYQVSEVQYESPEVAEEQAFFMLLRDVNARRKELGIDSLLEKNLRPFAQMLHYQRRTQYRGFCYVRLSEVDACRSGIPFLNNTIAETKEPVVKPQEQIQSAPIAVTVSKNDRQRSGFVPVTTPSSHNVVFTSLQSMSMMNEAYNALSQFKGDGAIRDFGKMSPETILDVSHNLIVYGKDDTNAIVVRAILQSIGNNTYKNITTNQPDTYLNYHGCGVVWFCF